MPAVAPGFRCADAVPAPDCPKKVKRFDWALRKEKNYTKLRESFMQLCRSCHAKYDSTDKGKLSRLMPIIQYDLNGKKLRRFTSSSEASKVLGISLGNLWSVLRGHTKTAGNFIWKYEGKKRFQRKWAKLGR